MRNYQKENKKRRTKSISISLNQQDLLFIKHRLRTNPFNKNNISLFFRRLLHKERMQEAKKMLK